MSDPITTRFTRLTEGEERRAEAIFAALLPMETTPLPAFESIDRTVFWRAIEETTASSFGPGLRMMVASVELLPLLDSRYRRRFSALSVDERIDFVESIGKDERYLVRQIVTSLKMLACLAYFDDPRVRARFPEASR